MKYTYLTPGPAELYFTYDYHHKEAVASGIPSISHRSERFQEVYADLKTDLRTLLNLPHDYHILFCASATEIWERIILSLVEKSSLHLVEGSFGEKFQMYSEALGRNAMKVRLEANAPFDINDISNVGDAELVAITQNETSTGSQFPIEHIEGIRNQLPDAVLAVDLVSTAPHVQLDYSQIDCAYFSVQKCFGLPPGLGVWLVSDRCVERARQFEAQGIAHRGYHSLTRLVEFEEKNQTPETPNTLNIYLLGNIIKDMLNKGIDVIRRETAYKSKLLYHTLDAHPQLEPAITFPANRSETVIVANTSSPDAWKQVFKQAGLILGDGYGPGKGKQIRIANFPTHSKELIEQVADLLEKTDIEGK